MFEGEGLAVGLANLAPGPGLARVLASVDRSRLSGHDRVVLLQAHQRMVSHYQAELYADVQAVWDAEREVAATEMAEEGLVLSSEIEEMASSEVRAALRLTRRSADTHVALAWALMVYHPEVWQALNQGRIDLARARIICDATCHLETEAARHVAEEVLERAGELTTGQLRARVARLCIMVDPDAARQRYQERLAERRIFSQPTDVGTANLYGMELPVDETARAMRRINALVRAAKTKHDPRTIDQVRADVFLDLLCGRTVDKRARVGKDQAMVDIRVDLATLAGLTESPGEIPGWGPVTADIARQVVEGQRDAEWRITVTGEEGEVVHAGTTRRRPTADQRRQVEARNPACVFPGCRMPAIQSDLDHNHPWAQHHRTITDDLAPLCRHDHNNRHVRGWKVGRVRPGFYQWTSPLGHTYTVGPDPP
ncbi:MAG TPA: DUF222 domain-containing protein [Acidimicrobiia bacterium]|nr:DUF222 domain-containing protein [Acidimicrobiia bacterium]